MKKDTTKKLNETDSSPRPEYDFEDGVRGKHLQETRQGYTVQVHHQDGSTIVQNFKVEDGAVILDPDVRQYFPDSESVNKALRCLIPLLTTERKAKA